MNSKIKKISIGSANFSKKYFNEKILLNQKKINEILKFGYQKMIRSIDTAVEYGSENKIGNFIKNQTKDDWIITTKVNNLVKYNLHKIFMSSKKKLGIKPKILLAHNLQSYLDNSFRKELFTIKKNENIKVGVSIYGIKELLKILDTQMPDIIQIPLNILYKDLYTNNFLKILKQNCVDIQVRSIFLRGIFFKDNDYVKEKYKNIYFEFKKLKKIATMYNLSLQELSLLFVANIKEIDTIILGVNSLNELKSNIKILKKKINKNVMDEILEIEKPRIEILELLQLKI